MAKFLSVNLAVPSASLLKFDDANKLAFDTSSWIYLNRYISRIENLSVEFSSVSVETGKALTKLRDLAVAFGSPKALRQLLVKNPNVLADSTPPSMLYTSIVWLVQRLHQSAAYTVSFLQGFLEARSGVDVKAGLQELGTTAGKAMQPISDLSVLLSDFKNKIIASNNDLSEACKADADLLHRKQEEVGALHVRVENVQKQIDELGFISSKRKRTEFEHELYFLKLEEKDTVAQAEKLRVAIGGLESILEDGAWLKSSLDDLLEFLDKLRKVWTTFGSNLTQMAVDASDDQLRDLNFVKKALGLDESIKQWHGIDQAAKQFTVEALVDIS
jgi:hypothetical protein